MYRYEGHELYVITGDTKCTQRTQHAKVVLIGQRYDRDWSLVAVLGVILGSVMVGVAAVNMPWPTWHCSPSSSFSWLEY